MRLTASLYIAIASATSLSPSLFGANIQKANNADALNLVSSWTGGAVPGSGDIATWGNTLTAARSTALGGNISWAGIDASAATFAHTITGANTNTLTLGASGINLSAGTANFNITGPALTLSANQTWNINSARTLAYGANTTGTVFDLGGFTLTKTGSGIFQATNGHLVKNGIFDVQAGTLILQSGSSRNITVENTVTANVASGAILRFAVNSGSTSGSTFAANVNLNGGTLSFAGGTSTNYSGNLVVNSASSINKTNSGATITFLISGNISGTGNLSINSGDGAPIVISGNNSGYSGNWTIGSGHALHVGGSAVIDKANSVASATGNLGSGSVANNGELVINRTGTLVTNNLISGTGTLENRSGNTTLSANNTYTGATAVNGGQLFINGDQTAAVGSVTVASTASLGGTGTIGGLATINGNLIAGNGTTSGTLTLKGGVQLQSTAVLTLLLDTSGTSTINLADSALTINGATLDLNIDTNLHIAENSQYNLILGASSRTGEFSNVANGATVSFDGHQFTAAYSTSGLTLTAIPEPSTYALAASAALLGIIILRRRKT
ncbi:MAG: hypothetical protein LBV12_03300 [Puniceicoccales bacterium]|jgi:autotransporter-associated beta strand protein|nr:hypothetical protein [Puniceicoccales bacterium]